MTTTFDLSSDHYQTYRRSQLRLLIGDAAQDDGPRPNQANYQDAELDAFIELENDDLNRAAARAFEALAAEWSRYAGSYRLGPESEEARQGEAFAARAKTLREMYGFATTAEAAGNTGNIVDWSEVYSDWVGKF